MGCATTSVKFASAGMNVILSLLAVGAIGWIAFNSDTESEVYVIAGYVTCVLILLFAVLGVVAAVRESVCLTATSAVFLLLLAISQIASTCLFLHPMQVQSGQQTVDIAWQANNMDGLQQKYECCGKTSAQDYVHLSQTIPPSCYANLKAEMPEHLFLKGCIDELQSRYDGDKRRFLIVSWVLVAFELLSFALAVFLAISFRNKQRRMQF
ncbi:hypothetical protein KR222_004748 [Zaprionus bogoriensis]|nr:hypothetical protein KR222_004748 [Zaprionus bogoriensis]